MQKWHFRIVKRYFFLFKDEDKNTNDSISNFIYKYSIYHTFIFYRCKKLLLYMFWINDFLLHLHLIFTTFAFNKYNHCGDK